MAVKPPGPRGPTSLAAQAPPGVFAVAGAGAGDRVEALVVRPGLRIVRSPRHASLLLVAGTVPERLREPLRRVHDQVPHPRATLWWGADPLWPAPDGRGPSRLDADDDPAPELAALHRALLRGTRPSEPALLLDEPPHPWRGRGAHGQGGEGMMGGTPYGRPMAMTGPDVRDGLALDRLQLTIGPFHPAFPPGLVLRLVLQGDVVQEVVVLEPPFARPAPVVCRRALGEEVPTAAVERARASLLLRRVARVLRVAGADAIAERVLRLALDEAPRPAEVRRTAAMVRLGAWLAMPAPVRTGDARDDVRARILGWLAEAGRALEAARTAEPRGARTGPVDSLSELGAPFAGEPEPGAALRELADRLPGREWGEAALLVASLEPAPTLDPGSPP